MNYPLIKKFLPELKILDHVQPAAIIASDLEAELAKGTIYYGYFEDTYELYRKHENNKYEALVIGYQPLESSKPVSREEILTALENVGKESSRDSHSVRVIVGELYHRIKKNGVK